VNYELETMLKDVAVVCFEVYHPGKYRERDEKNYENPQPVSPVIISRLSTSIETFNQNIPHVRHNSTNHLTTKFDLLLSGTRLANTAILYTTLFYRD